MIWPILSRLNALTTVGLYALAAVAFSAFISTHFLEKSTDVSLKVKKAVVKNIPEFRYDKTKNDAAFITFDIELDTEKLWNWNMKQLYLWVQVDYQTSKNDLNEVTIWDKIIKRKHLNNKSKVLSYKGIKNKYYFFDDGNGLLNNDNMTLTLHWNAVPNTGHFWLVAGRGSHKFQMPNEYTQGRF